MTKNCIFNVGYTLKCTLKNSISQSKIRTHTRHRKELTKKDVAEKSTVSFLSEK